MIYLLDTNVVSEVHKPKPHGAVIAWYAAHPRSTYGIPSIVLYELQQGAEMARTQHPDKAAELDGWIRELANLSMILSLDGGVASETARLMRRQPPHLFVDAVIAATARVHGLTVATRNTRDFQHFDVPLVNPFSFKRE